MKKNISILLFLIFMVGFLFFFFNGNPIKKANSKEIAREYLVEKYPEQSFAITNVAYYPGEGTYIVHVVSKDGTIEGNIDVRNERVTFEELTPK